MGTHFVSIQVGDSASLVANDRYGGQPLEANQMRYAVLSSSLPDASLDEQGRLFIAPGTPPGSYGVVYSACLRTAPLDCGDGRAFVTVTVPTITFSADRPTVQQILQPPPPPPPPPPSNVIVVTRVGVGPQPTLTVPLPQLTPGILGAPQPQMDAIFESAYAASPMASEALNGIALYTNRLQQIANSDYPPEVQAQMLADTRETIAHYAKIAEAEYEKARRDFWSAVTQAPDGPTQQKLSELNARISAKLLEIERSMATSKAVTHVVSLLMTPVDMMTGGQLSMLVNAVSEAIIQGVDATMLADLQQLVAERAAIDGTGRRAFVAMGMTDRALALLERGEPYAPDERALLDHVASVVKNSQAEVASHSAELFRTWMTEQKALRAAQGGGRNLAVLFDVGTPPPDFTMRAMAMAGLGPAGSSGNAALTAVLSKSPLLAAGQVLDNTGLRDSLADSLFPHLARRQQVGMSADQAMDLGQQARAAQQQRNVWRTGHAPGKQPAWVPSSDPRPAVNIKGRPAWTATSGPSQFGQSAQSIDDAARQAGGVAEQGDDVLKRGISVLRKAPEKLRNLVSNNIKTAAKIFQAGGSVAGVAIGVAIDAGQAADSWDNGQAKLDKAAQDARNAKFGDAELRQLLSGEDGRASVVNAVSAYVARQSGWQSSASLLLTLPH